MTFSADRSPSPSAKPSVTAEGVWCAVHAAENSAPAALRFENASRRLLLLRRPFLRIKGQCIDRIFFPFKLLRGHGLVRQRRGVLLFDLHFPQRLVHLRQRHRLCAPCVHRLVCPAQLRKPLRVTRLHRKRIIPRPFKLLDLPLQLILRPLPAARLILPHRLPRLVFRLLQIFRGSLELHRPQIPALLVMVDRRLHLCRLDLTCPPVPALLIMVDCFRGAALRLPLLHRHQIPADRAAADGVRRAAVAFLDFRRALVSLIRRLIHSPRHGSVVRIELTVLYVPAAAVCLELPQRIKAAAPRAAGASLRLSLALRLPSAPCLIFPERIQPCPFLCHLVLLTPAGYRTPPCSVLPQARCTAFCPSHR